MGTTRLWQGSYQPTLSTYVGPGPRSRQFCNFSCFFFLLLGCWFLTLPHRESTSFSRPHTLWRLTSKQRQQPTARIPTTQGTNPRLLERSALLLLLSRPSRRTRPTGGFPPAGMSSSLVGRIIDSMIALSLALSLSRSPSLLPTVPLSLSLSRSPRSVCKVVRPPEAC